MKKSLSELRMDFINLVSLIDGLDIDQTSVLINPSKIIRVYNYAKSIDILNRHIELGKDAEQYLNGIKTVTHNDIGNTYREISETFKHLYNQSMVLIEMIDYIIPKDKPDSINVKFTKINDFDDLAKFSKDIQMALSQVILDKEINGEIKISRVESGSILFNVFIGALAVQVVASLVWSAAVVGKKMLEVRLLQKQIRGLKIKNETLEDVLSAIKEETKLALQAEAEFVNTEIASP